MKKPKQPIIEDLKAAIKKLHDCQATHVEDIAVIEKFGQDTVWEGIVQVFDLIDHPTAKRCYAWSHAVEGSSKRKFYAVLHQEPVGIHRSRP